MVDCCAITVELDPAYITAMIETEPINVDISVPIPIEVEIGNPAISVLVAPNDIVIEIGTSGPPGPPGPPGVSGLFVNVQGIAGVNLGGHRAVTRNPAGFIIYATNDDLTFLSLPIWVTTGAANMGDPVMMVAEGEMTEPSWSWTPGSVYLGVNGLLTQVPPSLPGNLFSAQIGYAPTSDKLYVDREQSIVLG